MTAARSSLVVLGGAQIKQILQGKEQEIVTIVQRAYEAHAQDRTSLPFSTFLRFPNQPRDRIIGLPAFIGDDRPVAGIKWVSSFPENLERGIERASAVIALNDTETGRPYAILEGSLINAARTAASAALAAKLLLQRQTGELVLIGCGPMNQTIARFTVRTVPGIKKISLYDTTPERAATLSAALREELAVETAIAPNMEEAVKDKALVSIATNAAAPTIHDRQWFADDSVILHISLRDIDPGIILASINVVDDTDHVNRENTSIHLASQQTGNTGFVTATIGDVSLGKAAGLQAGRPVIYSPFGLGILDIKVGQYLYDRAVETGQGTVVEDFFTTIKG